MLCQILLTDMRGKFWNALGCIWAAHCVNIGLDSWFIFESGKLIEENFRWEPLLFIITSSALFGHPEKSFFGVVKLISAIDFRLIPAVTCCAVIVSSVTYLLFHLGVHDHFNSEWHYLIYIRSVLCNLIQSVRAESVLSLFRSFIAILRIVRRDIITGAQIIRFPFVKHLNILLIILQKLTK